MKTENRFRDWLMEIRASARMAFLMRLIAMGVGSLASMVWMKLLVSAMGKSLFGMFVTFQAASRLGGLGDMGISGAIGVRAGQMIGRGEYDQLRRFLASARTFFLIVAFALAGVFAVLSPWLPKLLGFKFIQGAGSLTMLFETGALSLFLMIIGGYFNNLNAAYGTVTWPILPSLLFAQLAFAAHWLLARSASPLWEQSLPYVAILGLNIGAVWYMLKLAHPWLGELRPLKSERPLWRELMASGGWIYLYSLGNLIFSSTDRLLVNAGFGASAVTPYYLNYKPCELAIQAVLSATFVSQVKINQWIANRAEESQQRARIEVQRLCQFQAFIGVGCALGYLALDNLFIRYLFGPANLQSSWLQWAFALNLAVTAGGDAGIQIAGLCGPRGLRKAGTAIGLTGLLNLALSYAAMKIGWMEGIAYATVVAQSVLSIALGLHTCRQLKIPFARWVARSWLIPLVTVAVMALIHYWIGSTRVINALILLGIGAVLLLISGRAAGLNLDFVRYEWNILRGMLGKGQSGAS